MQTYEYVNKRWRKTHSAKMAKAGDSLGEKRKTKTTRPEWKGAEAPIPKLPPRLGAGLTMMQFRQPAVSPTSLRGPV